MLTVMFTSRRSVGLRPAVLGLVVCSALGASTLVGTSPAAASPVGVGAPGEIVAPVVDISEVDLHTAIDEARDSGFVVGSSAGQDGSMTTTIDLGRGFTFDLVEPSMQRGRLGAGSDAYGAYVSFNSTDQAAIINGAGWGLGATVCLISGGTFCVVAGAIIAAATFAVSTNGLRCGSKSLRVYPFSGRDPRCA